MVNNGQAEPFVGSQDNLHQGFGPLAISYSFVILSPA